MQRSMAVMAFTLALVGCGGSGSSDRGTTGTAPSRQAQVAAVVTRYQQAVLAADAGTYCRLSSPQLQAMIVQASQPFGNASTCEEAFAVVLAHTDRKTLDETRQAIGKVNADDVTFEGNVAFAKLPSGRSLQLVRGAHGWLVNSTPH